MKKLLAIVLTIVLSLGMFATTALADDPETTVSPVTTESSAVTTSPTITPAVTATPNYKADKIEQRKQKQLDKLKKWQDRHGLLKPKQQIMRQNQFTLKQLHIEFRAEAQLARERIKAMYNGATTDEQLAKLKADLEALQTIMTKVNATHGKVAGEMVQMRGNKKNQDVEGMKTHFDNAIAVQEQRIALYKEAIAALKLIAVTV